MKKLMIALVALGIHSHSYAAFVDLGASYWYSEQLYGQENENKVVSQTTSVNWAWYLWSTTAIELNYQQTLDKDDFNTDLVDGGITINRIYKEAITSVYGVGIRQALASRESMLIPSIFVGVAKQTSKETTTYTINGTDAKSNPKEIEQDSGQISFALRIRLTKLMGLRFSARSVFPDFDTSKIRNNVTYSAGLSWVF